MSYDHTQVLKLAKEGKWEEAHRLAQEHSDERSCLLHGYLHRIEGDLGNASYWYRRGGETLPDNTLEEEAQRLYEILEK